MYRIVFSTVLYYWTALLSILGSVPVQYLLYIILLLLSMSEVTLLLMQLWMKIMPRVECSTCTFQKKNYPSNRNLSYLHFAYTTLDITYTYKLYIFSSTVSYWDVNALDLDWPHPPHQRCLNDGVSSCPLAHRLYERLKNMTA